MKRYIIVLIGLVIGNIALTAWNSMSTPKVAYVRSQELVQGYFGMKEAVRSFQAEQQSWKRDLDTLHADLQRSISQARQYHVMGKSTELERLEPIIKKQQDDLFRYREAMEKKSAEDEQRMLNGVLGQVNAFVERYAKEKGYHIVLGTTDAGSLLYANGDMDITEELLVAMNMDYDGVSK